MIVNPQLFNYRLIIGSLLVVLTVLGIYSFTNYESIKSYEEFLEQEKHLIETELAQMLESYDDLSNDYDLMASQLQEAKRETKTALESLRLLKSDLSIITKFKEQLIILKSKSTVLLSTIDSLDSANKKLEAEKRYAFNTIKKNSAQISNLENKNDSLSKTIDMAAVLKASSVSAEAFKLVRDKKKSTKRARRANAIDVCVTLAENPLTEKGKKDIYIQIVSPEGNVIADKKEVIFGNTSLIYSEKKIVDFNNSAMDVCSTIQATDNDKPLSKGFYFINVFNQDRKLGGTSIELR